MSAGALGGSARRISAIARKEFIHLSRDWRMIVAALLMPLIQLTLFAYAISFDVRDLPTVVLDRDRTPESRAYLDSVTQSGFFRIRGGVENEAAIDRAFDRGEARVAIVIAPGFGDEIAAGRAGAVAVLIDGSEPNSAGIGRNYALALNQSFGARALASWAAARGADTAAVGTLEPRMRLWYNPEGRSATFLVPGLMVVVIMIVIIQQTAVTLVKERDQGTLEQLVVSPLKRGELIVGKVLPWALLGFADTVFITAAALAIFQVPLRGDITVLAVAMFLFVLASLSIGLVVSAIAPTPESANLMGLLFSFLPGFLLSGMAFPLSSIPKVLQWLSYGLPARYMVDVSRAVFLRGASWDVLAPDVAALAVFAVAGLTVATLLHRRRA